MYCSYKVIKKDIQETPQFYSTNILFIDKKLENMRFAFSYQKENASSNPASLEFYIYCGGPNICLSEEEKYIYIEYTKLFKQLHFKPVGGTLGDQPPYNEMCYYFILEPCRRISSMVEFEDLVDDLLEVLSDI